MPYEYAKERDYIFTDDGQKMFLKIRDKANALCAIAGCASVEKAISECTGSNWHMFACVDRLVELGEFIYLLPFPEYGTPYQFFRKNGG